MLALKGGTVYTMEDRVIPGGTVWIDDGRIVKITENADTSGADEVLDVPGMTVMPGMIDAHCHVGMREYGVGEEGVDGNEMTQPVTAECQAVDGINPYNSIFRDSYEAGITTICVGPGSANVVGGLFCLMKTYGKGMDDQVIRNPYALKAAFGENPKRCHGRMSGRAPATRMGSIAMLRGYFYQAKAYMAKQEAAAGDPLKMPPYDAKLESFAKVLRREIPLKCHAHRADDLFTAIRVGKEFDIDITLEHVTDGKLIARDLKAEGVPLIIGPVMCERYKVEMMGIAYDTAKVLNDEGIDFAFCTDGPVVPQLALPLVAGYCVSFGLPEDAALRAITINPAKILKITDRVGSLAPGKDADIVVYDGHPFDLEAKVRLVLVNGEKAYDRLRA